MDAGVGLTVCSSGDSTFLRLRKLEKQGRLKDRPSFLSVIKGYLSRNKIVAFFSITRTLFLRYSV